MKLQSLAATATFAFLRAVICACLLPCIGCQVTRKPDSQILLTGLQTGHQRASDLAASAPTAAPSSPAQGSLASTATVRGQSRGTPPSSSPSDLNLPGSATQSGTLPPPVTIPGNSIPGNTGAAGIPSYPSLGPGGGGLPVPGPGTGPGASTSPYASPYDSQLAPGVSGYPSGADTTLAPGALPAIDPITGITAPPEVLSGPLDRIAPIDVYVQEARTGRIILGGAVNSDLGVSGQLIIDERNFDILRFPRSLRELWSGRAFRGGGQNFRAELMPGSQVQRYTVSWTEPHLLNLPYSFSVGGFLYTRQYRDWTEQRLGGRVALGYEVTKDLSISTELRMEDVKLFDPRLAGVDELDTALGSNDVYRGRFRLAHDTRDSPIMASRGGLVEIIYDQVFGEYDYPRAQVNLSRYHLMRERPDGGGRHVLANTWRMGITGAQTPIFDNFFAGGYSTLRGFSFRGASPKVGDVQVGGEFMFLGSTEYIFPLTADEMLRGVAFVDYGTVEQDLEITADNFRVAPGFGFRVAVPALGPAPLAFDFAVPINYADTDDRQVFAFFMGYTRS